MKRRAKRRKIKVNEQIEKTIYQKGFGFEVPPVYEFVVIYFDQKGLIEIAGSFYSHYQACSWKTVSGTTIRNWKEVASEWIFDYNQSLKLKVRKQENGIEELKKVGGRLPLYRSQQDVRL